MRTEGTGRSSQGRGLVTPGSRGAARGDFLCFPDGRSRPMRCLTSVHAVGLHQTSPRSSPTMAEAPGACPDPLRGHLEGVRRALAQELCGSREPPVRQARAPDERLAHGRPHRPHAARGPQTARATRCDDRHLRRPCHQGLARALRLAPGQGLARLAGQAASAAPGGGGGELRRAAAAMRSRRCPSLDAVEGAAQRAGRARDSRRTTRATQAQLRPAVDGREAHHHVGQAHHGCGQDLRS